MLAFIIFLCYHNDCRGHLLMLPYKGRWRGQGQSMVDEDVESPKGR